MRISATVLVLAILGVTDSDARPLPVAAAAAASVQLPPQSVTMTKRHQHPKGFTFEAPSDWMVEEHGGNVILLPPDGTFPREVYAANADVGYADARDPRIAPQLQNIAATMVAQLRRNHAAEGSSGGGSGYVVYVWDGEKSQTGAPVRVQFFVRAANNNLLLLMAVAPPETLALREPALQRIASSFDATGVSSAPADPPSSPAPVPAPERGGLTDSSSIANQWAQRLAGKMLTQLSSYSSGSSGGYSSETRVVLAPDGTFSGHRSSSVSIDVSGASGGSGGVRRFSGRWYIYQAENGAAVLHYRYDGGADDDHLRLENRNGQTFINGVRWFVTDPK